MAQVSREFVLSKGVGALAAMLLIAKITDFRRFASSGAFMAFLGIKPSENSTGDKRRGGPITRTGNPGCQTQLKESVRQYVKRPLVGPVMKANPAEVDAHSANIAINCTNRLHKRFRSVANRGKTRQVAIIAIARGLLGFSYGQ